MGRAGRQVGPAPAARAGAPEVAGHVVAGPDLDKRRYRLRADRRPAELGAQRAARVEVAARRGIDRRRHVAGEDDPRPADLRVGDRDRRQECLRVRVFGLREDPYPVGHLDDPAEVHHGDAGADVLDDAHVVGDEDVGQAELPLEVLEEVQDLRLDRNVERRDRLVADHEVGLEDEGPGDPDPLALAAAELVRVAVGVVRLEADHVHDPLDPGRPLAGGPHAVDPEALADALADRGARVERAEWVLEDDLHPPPVPLQGGAVEARDVDAVEGDRPGRRLDEAEQEASDGRLAAAGLPDEAKGLAVADLEAHPVHGPDQPDGAHQQAALDREVLHEVLDDDEGRAVGRAGTRGRRGRCGQRGRAGSGGGGGGPAHRPSSYRKQRVAWSGSTVRRSGCSAVHRARFASTRAAQRGAKRQ